MSTPTAALLLIGSELLSGKVKEANLHPLAEVLFSHGVKLCRGVAVADDHEAIVAEVNALSKSHTWLFTSGGVGPTHDDITMEAIAAARAQSVIAHPVLKRMLEQRYGARCTEAHLRMAQTPEGCILEGSHGTLEANTEPGEWPAVRLENIWIFPGVPEAFRMKLEILASFLKRSGARTGFVSLSVLCAVEETALVPAIDAIVAAFPKLSIGSYPKWFDPSYKTKITFDGTELEEAQKASELFIKRVGPELAWLAKNDD
jgi:molybdopterin-biosynthesis enzyme MoeA-like protein